MKRFLIGTLAIIGFLFLVLVGIGSYFYFHAIKSLSNIKTSTPEEFQKPAVLTGDSLLSKTTFYDNLNIGRITDIEPSFLNGVFDSIWIAGDNGAAQLNGDGGNIKTIFFNAGRCEHVQVLRLADGNPRFLSCGDWTVPVQLLDSSGNSLWSYGGGQPGVDGSAMGDLDGDGKLKVVVGFNGSGGVKLLDEQKNELWGFSEANVWHVEMTDIAGQSGLYIVHSDAQGLITVRKNEKDIYKQFKPTSYASHFSLCPWPNRDSQACVVLIGSGKVWLYDLSGNEVAQWDLPHLYDRGEPWACPVRIPGFSSNCLALLVDYYIWGRQLLTLFDPSGNVIYQEILDQTGEAIKTISFDGSSDCLLLGGRGSILKYKFK